MKHLAICLTTDWKQPYYRIRGYVWIKISIEMARSTHCCIQGSLVLTSQISVQRPQWEDGAGLHLYRQTSEEITKYLNRHKK